MGKRVIRAGTFETNSSSSHSLTILDKGDFDRWSKGKDLYLYECDDLIYTKQEVIERLKKDQYNKDVDWNNEDEVEETMRDDGYWTYDQWCDMDDLEVDIRDHTTKSGDEIVVLSSYGYSG